MIRMMRWSARLYQWVGLAMLALPCGTGVAHAVPMALQPSTLIDVSSGSGTGSGAVGTGHQIFEFHGLAGDSVTLAVEVTAIFPGTVFTDDDTLLFLFDDLGILLTENDDSGPGFSSLISGFSLPATGAYFAGVSTDPNYPIPYPVGVITGWEDDGDSHVAFHLNISGVTPVPEPGSLVLVGSWALAGWCIKMTSRRYGV